MTDRARGVLLTMLGVFVLSPDGLLVRLIGTDPWTLLFWRGLFMAAGLGSWLLWRHGAATKERFRAIGGPGLLAAVLFAGSTILFVNSIRLTAVANTLVIIAAAPLLAAVFSSRLLGEAIAPATWAAAAVVFGGLALIFADGLRGGTPAGDLCAAGSALCIAGYLVVLRAARGVDMIPALALGGLLAAVLVLPLARPLPVAARDMALLLVLGTVVMGLSFGLISIGPRYLPAPEVGLIMLLEAALGPLWVWLVLGEVPSAATVLGGGLVLAALAGHSLASLRQGRPT